jgi:hypothetical protein
MTLINPLISRDDFDAAIEAITKLRDRSLAAEADIREDDSLGDFSDGVFVTFDMDEDHSPDQLELILKLIDASRR